MDPHRSGNHTFRKFRDGDHRWPDLESQIFRGGPFPQVPNLRALHPAAPGKLPVRGDGSMRSGCPRHRPGEDVQGRGKAQEQIPSHTGPDSTGSAANAGRSVADR